MANTRTDYLAVSVEDTRAVPKKPINFIGFKEGQIKFEQELIKNNTKKGVRWGNMGAKKGKVTTDGDYTMDLDANEAGYWILAALGQYVKTTLVAGKAYKHNFKVANKLPTLSIEQLKGDPTGIDHEVSRSFGSMVESFDIEASDAVVSLKVGIKAHGQFLKGNLEADVVAGVAQNLNLETTEGLVAADAVRIIDKVNDTSEDTAAITVIDTENITADLANPYNAIDKVKVELIPQTPSTTGADCGLKEYTFRNVKYQFGADLTAAALTEEENIENWALSFKNNLEVRYGTKRASPSTIGEKSADLALKYTKYFENKRDRDNYLDNETKALIITMDLQTKISDTTENYKFIVKIPALKLVGHDLAGGTDDLYITEIESEVFYNCDEGQAVEIELINDVADYEL